MHIVLRRPEWQSQVVFAYRGVYGSIISRSNRQTMSEATTLPFQISSQLLLQLPRHVLLRHAVQHPFVLATHTVDSAFSGVRIELLLGAGE